MDEPTSGLIVTNGKGRPKKLPVGASETDAKRIRKDLQILDSQTLLLAVAWATDEEIRLARMYPEVFFMDVTSQTNSEKRELFIVAGKDCNAGGFVAARIFLPSEKRWVFHWIFSHCLPVLLGEDVISNNRLCITDGDTDSYLPLHDAINEGGIWGNSTHALCEFHLLSIGWKRLVKQKLHSDDAKVQGKCCIPGSTYLFGIIMLYYDMFMLTIDMFVLTIDMFMLTFDMFMSLNDRDNCVRLDQDLVF
ncbi:MAG: hypothetical protein ACRDL7_07790 [Gaiellaceae bacterium]